MIADLWAAVAEVDANIPLLQIHYPRQISNVISHDELVSTLSGNRAV
jgi:hypothetical protein